MGQEISHSHFSAQDFELFSERLRQETLLLQQWFQDKRFNDRPYQAGFELEAWLLNDRYQPAAQNHHFLDSLQHEMVVPELARFNFELNGQHRDLNGNVFTRMFEELQSTWNQCDAVAGKLDLGISTIGTLPTARLEDFVLENMSSLQRYRALNEQVLRMRQGHPLEFHIEGNQLLDFSHPDVMLEAATTSFQIHLRMPLDKAVRLYNAAKIISAPVTAISANSPYFLGRDLWAESRIPVFEQSVQVGQSDLTKRVSFGIRYANESMMEIFDSNLARYPIMLPRVVDEPVEKLAHLRLHNGTIWRWNRPLIGFDEDGSPHLRLEHRCVPAGPGLKDSIANAAFFYGLVIALAEQQQPPEQILSFDQALTNFYQCARHGLQAEVKWFNNRTIRVDRLLVDELLPLASQSLLKQQLAVEEVEYWLGIIRDRIKSGQTGAVWQRNWVRQHGADMHQLMQAYLQKQQTNQPVHQWNYD